MTRERRLGLQNNSKKFRELMGDDIVFFNKIEKKPEHREESLEHGILVLVMYVKSRH